MKVVGRNMKDMWANTDKICLHMMANKNYLAWQLCQVANTTIFQNLTLSQHKVKPVQVKKQGGLGVESYRNPNDGVNHWNVGAFEHLTQLMAWEDFTEFCFCESFKMHMKKN